VKNKDSRKTNSPNSKVNSNSNNSSPIKNKPKFKTNSPLKKYVEVPIDNMFILKPKK
jgi:hypothetical protein